MHVPLRNAGRRRGATTMECAMTLPAMALVLFALLDLGIAATRYNALAEVSRQIARRAVLHGALAPAATGSWGPTEFSGTLADSSPIVAGASGMAPTMIPGQIAVRVTWPNGDNSARDLVQVEASYTHVPLIRGICPWGLFTLRSVSTMQIVN